MNQTVYIYLHEFPPSNAHHSWRAVAEMITEHLFDVTIYRNMHTGCTANAPDASLNPESMCKYDLMTPRSFK